MQRVMEAYWFFCLLVSFLGSAHGANTCGAQHFVAGSGGSFVADWYLNCDDRSISVVASAKTSGWIAWGINKNSGMTSADIVYCYVKDSTGVATIFDAINNSEGTPPSSDVSRKSTNDIYDYGCDQNVTHTFMNFTRKLDTGDSLNDQVVTDKSFLIWAFGPDDDGGYHGNNKAALKMNFTTGCCAPFTTTFGTSATFSSSSSSTGGSSSSTGAVSSTGSSSTSGSTTGTPNPGYCPAGDKYNGSVTNDYGTFTLLWLIDCDTSSIRTTISAKSTGWIATGYADRVGSDGEVKMATADSAMAWIDDSGAHVSDRFTATEQVQPVADTSRGGQNDFYDINGTESNGVTTISWTRALDTGDAQNDRAIVRGKPMNILWAYNEDDDDISNQHYTTDGGSTSARGSFSVDFFTGQSSSLKPGKLFNKRLAHGVFMLLAIPLMFIPGIYIAKFLKAVGKPWFRAHVVLNSFGSAFVIIGFAIILWYKNPVKDSMNFDSPHQKLGLAIIIILFFQVIIGILANVLWNPERSRTPVFPDIMHWIFGYVAIILSFANIPLGFAEYGFSPSVVRMLQAIFYVWIAISLVAYLIAYVYSRTNKPVVPFQSDKNFYDKKLIGGCIALIIIGCILFIVLCAEMYKHA